MSGVIKIWQKVEDNVMVVRENNKMTVISTHGPQ